MGGEGEHQVRGQRDRENRGESSDAQVVESDALSLGGGSEGLAFIRSASGIFLGRPGPREVVWASASTAEAEAGDPGDGSWLLGNADVDRGYPGGGSIVGRELAFVT